MNKTTDNRATIVHAAPTTNCFRIGHDRFWCCEYPGDKTQEGAIKKLSTALQLGITHFIDLTVWNELVPYSQYLPASIHYLRFPVVDISCPKSVDEVYRLLLYIEQLLADPHHMVYLHCWGGVGRTGTIAACWLAWQHQTNLADTLALLRDYWKECPKSKLRPIPDTYEQEEFVGKFIDYLSDHQLYPRQ